jgi:hypothetical protein
LVSKVFLDPLVHLVTKVQLEMMVQTASLVILVLEDLPVLMET